MFVQKKRRCEDPREDFTDKDDKTTFPIQITPGSGTRFPFCPGKATWNAQYQNMFNALMIAKETGTHWEAGGIASQPVWWMDLLAWFVPVYDDNKFYSRAKSILGDGKSSSSAGVGPKPEGVARGRNTR